MLRSFKEVSLNLRCFWFFVDDGYELLIKFKGHLMHFPDNYSRKQYVDIIKGSTQIYAPLFFLIYFTFIYQFHLRFEDAIANNFNPLNFSKTNLFIQTSNDKTLKS